MRTESDEFIPTQQSLLSRLRNWDDQASWKAFFDTYWKLIYGVARKSGLTDAEAQDVVQETIISVAKQIPQFRYDPALGSFKGWLKQITRRRIMDHFRKKLYESNGQRLPREQLLSTALWESQPDAFASRLEQVWDEEWTKTLVEAALERIKGKVSLQHFQIFYLHVYKKLPARHVAQRLDVKLAEIYFAKYKVSRLLQREIKLLENEAL
jgi:RNA polymerase sigma factor (sigma-70 family)